MSDPRTTDSNEPNQISPAQTASRIDLVLGEIDRQIEQLRLSRSESGWTHWALLAAMGTILWLLSDDLDSSLPWQIILGWVFIFSLTIDLLWLLYKALSPSGQSKYSEARFRIEPLSGAHRVPDVVITIARYITLLYFGLSCFGGLPLWVKGLLLFFYGSLGIGLFVGVLACWFGVGIPAIQEERPKSYSYLLLIHVGLALAVLWGILPAFLSETGFPAKICIQVAGLLVGFVFLLQALVREQQESPMLRSLVEVRRDLALGRIEVAAALEQLDLISRGLRLSNVFQLELDRVLGLVENLSREIRQCVMDFETASNLLDSADPKNSHKDAIVFTAVLQRTEDDTTRVVAMVDDVMNEVARFKKKVGFVWRLSGKKETVKKEATLLTDKLDSALDKGRLVAKEMLGNYKTLKTKMQSRGLLDYAPDHKTSSI